MAEARTDSAPEASNEPPEEAGQQPDVMIEAVPVPSQPEDTRETLLTTTTPAPAEETKVVAAPLPFKPKRGFRRGK